MAHASRRVGDLASIHRARCLWHVGVWCMGLSGWREHRCDEHLADLRFITRDDRGGLGVVVGERFSKRQMLGVVLAMLGVVHVVVRGEWTHLTQVQLVPGDLWVVAAAIAWAAYALLQKKWHSPLGSTARLASICMGGIVVLLPFAVWELMSDHTPVLGLQAAQLVLVTALVPGLAAYWIYGWTQKILGASRVAVTLYLGPLYSGIAAWLVLNESLGWHHVWGGAMILSGVALVMAVKATPANP